MSKELEEHRKKVKEITLSIMKQVKERMDLVSRIGEIKRDLGLSIIDKNAEQELRESVLEFSNEIGLDKSLALRILNILLEESRRLQGKKESVSITPTSIFAKTKELERNGKKIIHLEVGEPDLDPPYNVREAINEAMILKRYRYTEPAGIKELRDAIANSLYNKIDSNNIIVTPGGRFGVYLAISSLKEGEEIIVIDPSWPAYIDCARLANVSVKRIRSDLANDWNINIKELENAISTNTKMLILNYPNNPTGKILNSNCMKEIIDIARADNLIVMSDEVYSSYAFKEYKSILEFDDIDYILISSFSKAYAMTGFRIGFIASNNPNLINAMIKHQSIALTSVAEPIQYAALKALDEDNTYYAKVMKERIEYLADRLESMPVSFYKPDGGMYIFARVDKEGFDSLEFADKMLEKGLGITPGIAFGDYNNYLRISACNDIATLEEGLKILEENLR